MPADKPETSFFTLPFANDSFSSRCKDVFSSLETIEKKHEAYEHTRATSKSAEQDTLMKTDPDESSSWEITDKKQDTTFSKGHQRKQPTQSNHTRNWRRSNHNNGNRRDKQGFYPPVQRPPRRSQKVVPGYKIQPEKWTCYSLDDVKSNDMSEKSNQRAAFEFLAERKRAREKKHEEDKFEVSETACSKGVISFSRPKSSTGGVFCKKSSTYQASQTSSSFSDDGNDEERHLNLKLKSDGNMTFNESESDRDDESKNDETFKDPQINDDSSERQFNFKTRKSIKRNIRHKEDESEDV